MVNSNASASAHGWNFQINAAIVFFLEDLKRVNKIKVEGSSEDIELFLDDGIKKYIQAKSQQKSFGPNKKAKKNLKSSIKTLFEASVNGDAEELMLVVNYVNPFGGNVNKYMAFNGGTFISKSYSEVTRDELGGSLDSVIKEVEDGNSIFPRNLFKVIVLPYDGDERDSRERIIKSRVKEFLPKV